MTKQQRILFQEQPEQIAEAREHGQQRTVTILKTIAEMPEDVRYLFQGLLFGRNFIKDCLYDDEQELIAYLYGLSFANRVDGTQRTHAEAATHFNMTEEQVKEMECLALRKTAGYLDIDEALFAQINPKDLPSEQDLLRVQELRNTVLDSCSELDRELFLSYHGYVDKELDGRYKRIADKFGMTTKEVVKTVRAVFNKIVDYLKLNF